MLVIKTLNTTNCRRFNLGAVLGSEYVQKKLDLCSIIQEIGVRLAIDVGDNVFKSI